MVLIFGLPLLKIWLTDCCDLFIVAASDFMEISFVQNNMGNKFSPTTIVIPLTSEIKKINMPVHDILYKSEQNGLKSDSLILGEQVRVIDKSMILYRLGTLNDEECDKVIGVYLRNIPRKNRKVG